MPAHRLYMGLNEDMPCHEGQNADHPLALYGATKKANELLAHSYSHLFNSDDRSKIFYGLWSMGPAGYGLV